MEKFQSRMGDLGLALGAVSAIIAVVTGVLGGQQTATTAGVVAVVSLVAAGFLYRSQAKQQLDHAAAQLSSVEEQRNSSAQQSVELDQQVQQSERQLEALTEALLTGWSQVPTISIDRSGRVESVSAAVISLLGDDISAALGRRMEKVFHRNGQGVARKDLRGSEPSCGRFRGQVGNQTSVGYRVAPAISDDSMILVLHEINELEEAEAQVAHLVRAIGSLATPLEVTDESGSVIVRNLAAQALSANDLEPINSSLSTSVYEQESGQCIRLWHDRSLQQELTNELDRYRPSAHTLSFNGAGEVLSVGEAILQDLPVSAHALKPEDLGMKSSSALVELLSVAGTDQPTIIALELRGKPCVGIAMRKADRIDLTLGAQSDSLLAALANGRIEDAPYAIIRADGNGVVEAASPQACAYLGRSHDDLEGASAAELFGWESTTQQGWLTGTDGQEIKVQAYSSTDVSGVINTCFLLTDQSDLKEQYETVSRELAETQCLVPAELMIDENGRVISITKSAETFVRPGGTLAAGSVTDAERLLGQPLEAILSEEAREVIAAGQEVLTTGGRSYRFVRIGTVDGHELIRIEDISPFIVIKRISEVQRANDISATITPEGIIDSVSEKYLALLGRGREELIGMPISEIFDDMFVRTGGFEEYWSSLQGGKPGQARLERKRPDGDKVYVAAQHTPIYGNKGEIVCFLETLYDTSVYQEERRVSQQGQRDLLVKQRKILEDLSNCLGAVTRGDYTVKLPDDVPDDYLILKEDFDAAVSSLAEAEKRQQIVKEQQAHVVGALADSLASLADGKLDRTIVDSFPEEYESLRIDFNNAVERLHMVMSVIANTSEMLEGVSSDINESTRQLSQRTENQTITLEQTTQSFDQLTTHVGSTAERAQAAANSANAVLDEAQSSQRIVQDAVNAMELIESSSLKVSAILSVIDDIAFQTNLLALNAGVEAARAGESGRGFAVVAQEVRSLAQRSAESAREIKSLITTSSEQVSEGVHLVSRTGGAIGSILDRVQNVSSEIATIATSASEQAEGIAEINKAVSQIDQLTKENLVMAEESADTGSNLGKAANDLIDQIAHFKLSGRAAVTTTEPARSLADEVTTPKPPAAAKQQGSVPQFDGSAALAQEDWTEF